MATTEQKQTLEQLEQLVIKGDYASAKQFVLEHFQELPEEMRQQIMAELLADQLEIAAAQNASQVQDLQAAAQDTLGMIKEEVKEEMQNLGKE